MAEVEGPWPLSILSSAPLLVCQREARGPSSEGKAGLMSIFQPSNKTEPRLTLLLKAGWLWSGSCTSLSVKRGIGLLPLPHLGEEEEESRLRKVMTFRYSPLPTIAVLC